MTPGRSQNALDSLHFDNRFVRNLPPDPEPSNFRRQVMNACFSRVAPTQVSAPQLVAVSPDAAALLDLDEKAWQSDLFVQVFTGNHLLAGMDPFAMCYGGHQFGNWAGQLGDGRAINLGEVVNRQGRRWVLQLKGAGPTPYSRSADGLAVLRSSIREFLCSEAMFFLGIPTTRALSLTLTGETVERDMFYDGHPKEEPGAVVCRLSPSFIRFGNFQIHGARQENTVLQQLIDYTIRTDFPHLGAPGQDTYIRWFQEVCQTTCSLVLDWMRVGFVHGVMNTDNMSILGLTIDYGPYGWLEDYDPVWTPNTTDAHGRRYCFQNQGQIALWNLARLANAVYPVITDAKPLKAALEDFSRAFQQGWQTMMVQKLGLNRFQPDTDDSLIKNLLALLQARETDYTLFFRGLARVRFSKTLSENDILPVPGPIKEALYQPDQIHQEYEKQLSDWLRQYHSRIIQDKVPRNMQKKQMNRQNPLYVLRNYLAQMAIDKAENNDFSMVHELLEVMKTPYEFQPGKEKFAQKRPEWARNRPGCSMLSCSS
ncbi:MAG: YdiU family protein [Desulfotignum sp.]|nr:YdiU family protein [Desulfotignum sp.]